LDGFQYEDNVLQFVPTSEGYYDFVKNKYIYHYTDHLGNVRLSYTRNNTSLEIIEENNYYPFGLKHEGYNPLNGNSAYQYKYNGKELQTETGMYDYGARFYMPDIGRWGVVDPKAELMRRWSPYNYAFDNPIRFIDPDGRAPLTDFYNLSGKKIGTDGVNNGVRVVVTDNKEARSISKIKGNVDTSSVKSGATLPSTAVLKESLNVLDRTINNGGKKEESSIVMKDGSVLRGTQGPEVQYGKDAYASATLPDLPTGKTTADAAASIHSHPTKTEVVGEKVYSGNAQEPSATDTTTFAQYDTNVIVGPLGYSTGQSGVNTSTGKMETTTNANPNGIVIYNSSYPEPLKLETKAVKRILE
ncbi:RHS repeat domain-containing protein, partial [Chryseobacterium piperi]